MESKKIVKFFLKLDASVLLLVFFIITLLSISEIVGIIFDLIFVFVFTFWVNTLAKEGYKKLNAELTKRMFFFNICIVYLFFWSTFHVFIQNGILVVASCNRISIFGLYVFNFVSYGSILYVFYFVSLILKSIDKGKIIEFKETFGFIFCFIFLPVGIWIIQPKANKLADNV